MRCNWPQTLTGEVNAVVDVTSRHVRQIWKHAKIAKLSISSKRRMIECAHVGALWKSAMGGWTMQTSEMTLSLSTAASNEWVVCARTPVSKQRVYLYRIQSITPLCLSIVLESISTLFSLLNSKN